MWGFPAPTARMVRRCYDLPLKQAARWRRLCAVRGPLRKPLAPFSFAACPRKNGRECELRLHFLPRSRTVPVEDVVDRSHHAGSNRPGHWNSRHSEPRAFTDRIAAQFDRPRSHQKVVRQANWPRTLIILPRPGSPANSAARRESSLASRRLLTAGGANDPCPFDDD